MSELKRPFAVGDTVYILGKYEISEYAPLHIITARISHVDHKCFIAYGLDADSTWRFTPRHYNKSVFKTEQEAIDAWNRRAKENDHE